MQGDGRARYFEEHVAYVTDILARNHQAVSRNASVDDHYLGVPQR
jgi:hypothetical protein